MKIKEWITDNLIFLILVILIFSGIAIGSYKAWADIQNDKEIVVDGKITNVEYLGVAKGYYSWNALKLTFDNGESYTIVTGDDIDFTANSKFIIKLFWNGDDDYWKIVNMYKVPSED